jgi:hypothetical protein
MTEIFCGQNFMGDNYSSALASSAFFLHNIAPGFQNSGLYSFDMLELLKCGSGKICSKNIYKI